MSNALPVSTTFPIAKEIEVLFEVGATYGLSLLHALSFSAPCLLDLNKEPSPRGNPRAKIKVTSNECGESSVIKPSNSVGRNNELD